MGVKRVLAGFMAWCCVQFGAVSGAASLSIDEFYRWTNLERQEFMTTVLHFYYYRYSNDPSTAYKGTCMIDLYESVETDGNPYLLTLIMRDMDVARENGARDHTVEDVVQAVIDRECKAS